MRLWWQSFNNPNANPAYLATLLEYLQTIAAPETRIDVHGLDPPDRGFGRLAEFRCAIGAVDNALEAESRGYDVFVFGHFQEPGLYTARSCATIPVVGMGESSLHWAAQLGRKIALVTVDPVFTTWHHEQAELYGLGGRVSDVVAVKTPTDVVRRAFEGDEDAYQTARADFVAAAEPAVERGADVVLPAGGRHGLLFARELGMTVRHAPVVNCVAVALKCAEVAADLRRTTGLSPSRGSSFALAPAQARDDFRTLAAHGRTAGLGSD